MGYDQSLHLASDKAVYRLFEPLLLVVLSGAEIRDDVVCPPSCCTVEF